MVKIEEGKFYKTRDGRKVGPIRRYDHDSWTGDAGNTLYTVDGLRYFERDRGGSSDLISEWPNEETGPIRTITRREIVPGQYGCIKVESKPDGGYLHVRLVAEDCDLKTWYNAEQLREAAHILNQLAEALDQ